MKEQNVARAYAKSIIELAEEQNIDVATELTTFNETVSTSNNFEHLLFSEAFSVEEKLDITSAVLDKLGLSPITKNFVKFMVGEKRVHLFPLAFKEVIVIDDHKRGFLKGTIEGSDDSVSPEFLEKIKSFLNEKLNAKTELSYVKTDKVSAGYRVTVEDLQLDASLDNQLDNFKDQVLNK